MRISSYCVETKLTIHILHNRKGALIYNNLIFFLVAIVLFSTNQPGEAPLLPAVYSVGLVGVSLYAFYFVVLKLFKQVGASSSRYFKAETRATVLGLLVFACLIYVADIKYFLQPLSLADHIPSLVNIAGLAVYFVIYALIWIVARPSYQRVFDRVYTAGGFVFSNFKMNLPMVLPWLVLSIVYDLIANLPFPVFQELLASVYGDLAFFVLFLFSVIFFFPPMVLKLWGCQKLPQGELRSDLEVFCQKQKFSAEMYLWPLFEGRVLTAGVMGFIPGLRYILLTPAIIESMTKEELEAVMAHEIGHVKKYHLLLYVFLVGGFSVFMGFLMEPALRIVFSSTALIEFMVKHDITPDQMFTWLGTISMLCALVVYFRFVFGYFIRNFERQADAHVFKAIGHADSLVSAFERLAFLSGDIRDKPSWHHFGIGERVDYLEKCSEKPELVKAQDRKVRASLFAYMAVLVLTIFLVGRFPTEKYIEQYKEKYTEFYLVDKIENGSDDYKELFLAGDFMLFKKREAKAVEAYEMAINLEERDPELLNNLAWLYLTSNELSLRNPVRALRLARDAAAIKPTGFILDTVARAYWANALVEEAVATEKQAAFADPQRADFYHQQAQWYRSMSYEESMKMAQRSE